jgi:hypothetical protein
MLTHGGSIEQGVDRWCAAKIQQPANISFSAAPEPRPSGSGQTRNTLSKRDRLINLRLHLYARFVACCTLLLLISGAVVTTSHKFQSVHTVAGVAGTLLIAGLLLGARATFPRAAGTALAIAIADAVLGTRPSGPVVGTLHAGLGALLFASVAAIVLFTSPAWERDPDLVQDYGWPSLRFLSAAAALLVAVQIGFGAGFRHSAVGVMPHLLGALVVALFIMIVGAFVTHQFPAHASLRPMAVTFMSITGIQVFLGMTAFLMRLMQMDRSLWFLAISAAHVATGSVTFAISVMLAIEIRRSALPPASTS